MKKLTRLIREEEKMRKKYTWRNYPMFGKKLTKTRTVNEKPESS